jgi:diguanylate cyclase (GGDEF)-like protein
MKKPGRLTGMDGSKASLLAGIDIFAFLAGDGLAALARKMLHQSYLPGEAIFREGESGDELFVVLSGLVAVTLASKDAEDLELSRLGPGAFFGEMALLERAPRSATCTAVEKTDCLVLKAADFEALIVEAPGAATDVLERMLAIAAGRLLHTGAFLSQMVQWGDEARRRAITDAATGLFNRRYLDESLDGIVARARREAAPFSYAMFDLDRFGKLNAAYGAEFCDRLIVAVAGEFRKVFGEEDILVRYGGDEFCFILPGAPAEAEAKCEATCAALRALRFPGHGELRISCSIGLSVFSGVDSSPEELKERADKALYAAKEAGRNRAVAWPARTIEGPKRDIPSIACKKRIIANIIGVFEQRDRFLIAGHKDPDEDCISSMVAFALLVGKFNKKAAIVLGPKVQDNFDYLLNICRFNSIEVIRDSALPPCDALVLVDTPKPEMMDRPELFERLRADPAVVKVELDHHLAADSRYYGDADYRLVYEASSTCEIIGYLAMKIQADAELMAKHQIDELLSRNLVLAILSGMIGDSQMGRYLKTRRERWFYGRFSALFERMLSRKTRTGSGNFSSKEQVFDALASLSKDEDECFRAMSGNAATVGRVGFAAMSAETSGGLFARYGKDTFVAVSKALVDHLAESSGYLGLVCFYDDPGLSPFVQFRLRRSQAFTAIDLRDAIARLGITNGGGHPGAVGLRVEREAVPDIEARAKEIVATLNAMIDEAVAKREG